MACLLVWLGFGSAGEVIDLVASFIEEFMGLTGGHRGLGIEAFADSVEGLAELIGGAGGGGSRHTFYRVRREECRCRLKEGAVLRKRYG